MRYSKLFIPLCLLFMISAISQNKMRDILSPYSFETHYQLLDNAEIAYVKEGSGSETILLIHGLSSNVEAWKKNVKVLSEKYTVIAVDLPGYGRSSIPEEATYTPTYFSEILKEFLQKMAIDKVILAGHSMGGQTAIRFNQLFPEMVQKIILVAPAGIETFTEEQGTLFKTFITPDVVQKTSDTQIEINYKMNFYQMPEDVNSMIQNRKNIIRASDFEQHTKAIAQSVHGMIDDPVFEDLEKIKVPVLIIFGQQDNLIPNKMLNPMLSTVKVAEIAHEKIENSNLEMIENAGHFVQYERPEDVNKQILIFFQK